MNDFVFVGGDGVNYPAKHAYVLIRLTDGRVRAARFTGQSWRAHAFGLLNDAPVSPADKLSVTGWMPIPGNCDTDELTLSRYKRLSGADRLATLIDRCSRLERMVKVRDAILRPLARFWASMPDSARHLAGGGVLPPKRMNEIAELFESAKKSHQSHSGEYKAIQGFEHDSSQRVSR